MKTSISHLSAALALVMALFSCTKEEPDGPQGEANNGNETSQTSNIIGKWTYESTECALEESIEVGEFKEDYLMGSSLTISGSTLLFKDTSGSSYQFPYTLDGNQIIFETSESIVKLDKDKLTLSELSSREPLTAKPNYIKHKIYKNWQIYLDTNENLYYIKTKDYWIRCFSFNETLGDLPEDAFYSITITHWKRMK